jgi:hypothetical protein
MFLEPQVELSSLEAGIAAAQQADIFVGAHGANIANAWLMRPGSSVVELTMHGFEDNKAHLNLARRNLAVSPECSAGQALARVSAGQLHACCWICSLAILRGKLLQPQHPLCPWACFPH